MFGTVGMGKSGVYSFESRLGVWMAWSDGIWAEVVSVRKATNHSRSIAHRFALLNESRDWWA